MLGAIAGDIIGSRFEFKNNKSADFELFTSNSRFTDDTILTVALADSILTGENYVTKLKQYTRKYPMAGYGGFFLRWAMSSLRNPYNSWGNGSAMRVSPVGFAFNSLVGVMSQAKLSAEVTHNHPEGIKGAQAIASSIFLARSGQSKSFIKDFVESTFRYNLGVSLDEIRPTYRFDVSCMGSVPQAIRPFLESKNFEDSIRLAISIGGDSDTLGAMNGGIAQAFYGKIPEFMKEKVIEILDDDLNIIVQKFCDKYKCF